MLTEKDWMKLRDFNKQIALRVQAKLPGDWYLTLEEVEGAVYDAFVKLLAEYRPGAMSATSYCWQFGEARAYGNLMREYKRLKSQTQAEEDFGGADGDGEQPRQYGEGEVKALSVDEREARDTVMEAKDILDGAEPEDKEAMRMYMEGHTLEEIGGRLGIDKSAVLKRFRKYGKGRVR